MCTPTVCIQYGSSPQGNHPELYSKSFQITSIRNINVLQVTMDFYVGYKYKSPSKKRRDRPRKQSSCHSSGETFYRCQFLFQSLDLSAACNTICVSCCSCNISCNASGIVVDESILQRRDTNGTNA